MPTPAIFLDRDGVLVEEIHYERTGETEAPLVPEDVRLLPGAARGVRALRDAGFLIIVISNQGGVAKGKTSLHALWRAHERFLELMRADNAAPDDAFYSFGHPDGVTPHFSGPSLDRKPSPYNLLIAAAKHDVVLSASWMIGDRETDVACGAAAGTRTVRIASPGIESSATHVRSSLLEALDVICGAARR